MRIVGGIYRGRTLNEFSGKDVRPTLDMARESLFNILRNKIEGAYFWDLFCGTGAIGIEALSRSAKEVVFVDNAKESVQIVKSNLEKLKINSGATVVNASAGDYLKSKISKGEKADIIFLDPPYKSEIAKEMLSLCEKCVADDGVVIFESEKRFCEEIEGLTAYDFRKYGRAVFTFFRKGV